MKSECSVSSSLRKDPSSVGVHSVNPLRVWCLGSSTDLNPRVCYTGVLQSSERDLASGSGAACWLQEYCTSLPLWMSPLRRGRRLYKHRRNWLSSSRSTSGDKTLLRPLVSVRVLSPFRRTVRDERFLLSEATQIRLEGKRKWSEEMTLTHPHSAEGPDRKCRIRRTLFRAPPQAICRWHVTLWQLWSRACWVTLNKFSSVIMKKDNVRYSRASGFLGPECCFIVCLFVLL